MRNPCRSMNMNTAPRPTPDTRPTPDLPAGWRWVALKNLGIFEAGGTPAKEKTDYWNGDIPFVTGADVTNLNINKSYARAFLSPSGLYSGKTAICKPGTVLIVTRTRVGRAGIARELMGASQDITAFHCNDEIVPEFLCRYLHNISEYLIENCRGATIQGLLREVVDNLPIPLPPLPEQQRIAAVLNEQMTSIERARAAAKDRLNAIRALPAACLRQVFPQPDQPLPEDWRWIKLGDHTIKVGSGITPLGGQTSYQKTGIPLIRSQNVHMNRFSLDGLAFISEKQDQEMSGSKVIPNDVLLNITGASIGRVCVVPESYCPANVNQHVSIIRLDQHILPAFLSYYISIPSFQSYILNSQAGATRQALTKAIIEDFNIPIPPLNQQQRIVAILNEQMVAIERARAAAEAELAAINALPAALLRRAFAGEN